MKSLHAVAIPNAAGVICRCPPCTLHLGRSRDDGARPSVPACSYQDSPFPHYDKVTAEDVVPGIRALLGQLHKEIDLLEATVEPTWEGEGGSGGVWLACPHAQPARPRTSRRRSGEAPRAPQRLAWL